jgi:hypothetical protein
MNADVAREEFTDLEARVRVIDREVEGEKLVTRHILEQTRRNGDDLAAIKSRLDRVEDAFDGVDLKDLVRKVDGLDRKIDDLTKSLPNIVGEVMREILRARNGQG